MAFRFFAGFVLIILCSYSTLFSADWYASGRGGAIAGGGSMKGVDAGLAMLKKDGKAADAAAATILTLAITDYGMFCMGGEVPFIHYDVEKNEVKVLSGQGRAPRDTAAINWLLQNGVPKANTTGNIKSAAVPAVIDLVVQAMKLWGKLRFEDVAQPTLQILDAGGQSWYANLAATMRKLITTEQTTAGTREQKLQAVSDRFYKGDIADALDSWYKSNGGLLRKKDLEMHITKLEDPIKIVYKGYTVYKCDVWTQGAVLLQSLRLLEGYDLKSMGHLSADFIHVTAEAMKLAFADRDEYYADPEFADVPLTQLLSDQYTNIRRPLIKMNRASDTIVSGDPRNMLAVNPNPHPKLKWPHGTTTCCVVDQYGNMVASTPSGWGSTAGAGSTGVPHGTRLISIHNWSNHPNRLAPGKRPCITLTPTLVMKNGKPILAISVAGGDIQDQTALNLFLDFVEFGFMPQDAVTKPRFSTEHLTGFFSQVPPVLASLECNTTVASSVRTQLSSRGHKVTTTSGAVGNPVMIYVDQTTGTAYAAGDPNASRKVGAILNPTWVPEFTNSIIRSRTMSVVPQSGRVAISYHLINPKAASLEIYNPRGTLITSLAVAEKSGENTVFWNGTNESAERSTAGCYMAVLCENGNRTSVKFMLSH